MEGTLFHYINYTIFPKLGEIKQAWKMQVESWLIDGWIIEIPWVLFQYATLQIRSLISFGEQNKSKCSLARLALTFGTYICQQREPVLVKECFHKHGSVS